MKKLKIFISALAAGAIISIAAYIFLLQGGIVGSILFAWGLITIICLQTKLYTGVVGYVETKKDCIHTLITLIGNAIGCFGTYLLLSTQSKFPFAMESAIEITNNRISAGFIPVFIGGIGCGLIIMVAVMFAKEKDNWLPLLFGIPVFINSSFCHSIADFFYYSASGLLLSEQIGSILIVWIAAVLGNLVGCKIPYWIKKYL